MPVAHATHWIGDAVFATPVLLLVMFYVVLGRVVPADRGGLPGQAAPDCDGPGSDTVDEPPDPGIRRPPD